MVNAKAPKGRRITCRECRRDVELVTLDDGSTLKLDTEVISVVTWPEGSDVVKARQLHAAVCHRRTARSTS